MKALVTITDLTRMQEDRVCVAGYLPDGTCVRPVLERHGGLLEAWLRANGQLVVRPFATVELDLYERVPDPPHTEDHLINPVYRVPRGMLASDEQRAFLETISDESVNSIFGAAIHQGPGWYVLAGEGRRSLGTVRAIIQELAISFTESGLWNCRLLFADQTGETYRLSVSDLTYRYYLDHLRVRENLPRQEAARRLTEVFQEARIYLRIGLARGWEKFPDRCYLQITGVYSFPDHLGGRCFADFASR